MYDMSNNEVRYGNLNATNINNDNHIDDMSIIKVKVFISGTHKHEEQ